MINMENKEKTIEELKQEIESLKCALSERTKNAEKKAVVDFGKMASELNEGTGKFIDTVKPVAKETADKVGKKIKERPFVSVCAALGAGILLAGLAKRKNNN